MFRNRSEWFQSYIGFSQTKQLRDGRNTVERSKTNYVNASKGTDNTENVTDLQRKYRWSYIKIEEDN